MRKIALIAFTLLISYVSFGQITKKMPYEFDNTVTHDSTLIINDSIKISASGFSYGEFVKIDTNASGELILVSDTISTQNSTLPYDSITSAPLTETASGWRASDSSNNFSIGGANDTSTASLYIKSGIARRIFDLGDAETSLDGSRGDIFQVGINTSPTAINDFNGIEQGRIIMLIGRTSGNTSGNTSTIHNVVNKIVLGAAGGPIILDDDTIVTFMSCLDATGNLILLEISRNQ